MMQKSFQIKIANHVIGLKPNYKDLAVLCREYITEEIPEVWIEVTDSDILYEREKSAKEDVLEGSPVRQFSDGYLETLAVYRKITEYLLDYDILLFHGSVIAVDEKGYLFTAGSGIGKSTHTGLWREKFGDRAVMINDDKPLLSITEQGVTAWGTPWDGKHRLSTNASVLLKAVSVLHRDAVNHIEPIDSKQIYPFLLQQVYRPQKSVQMMKTLKLLDKLIQWIDFWALYCNMELEAADVAYEAMSGSLK